MSLKLGLLTVLFVGCSFGTDLSRKACPCTDGWDCDEIRNLCVPTSGSADASMPDGTVGIDATTDAPLADTAIDTSVDALIDVVLDATPDATIDATVDATIDANVSPCAVANTAFVCEDFEDATLPIWTGYGDQAGTMVVTDRPYSGTRSLRSSTSTAGGVSALSAPIPLVDSGELYVRIRIRPQINSELNFFATSVAVPPYDGIGLAVSNNRLEVFATQPGEGTGTTNNFVPDQWNCVLLHTTVAEAGTLRISLNDGPVATLQTDTLPQAGIDGVDTGVTYTDGAITSATIDLDELIVSREALSCD